MNKINSLNINLDQLLKDLSANGIVNQIFSSEEYEKVKDNKKSKCNPWYGKDREGALQRKREYNERHKEERREYARKYYQEHKKECAAYSSLRYQAHKEEERERLKKWRANNLDHSRKYAREYYHKRKALDPNYGKSKKQTGGLTK